MSCNRCRATRPPMPPTRGKSTGFALLSIALLTVSVAACQRHPEAPPAADRFVPVDASGQLQPGGETLHACVYDTRTRLMWELKQVDGLHDARHTYSWYASERASHMSEPGQLNGGRCDLQRCDTEAFVEAVNAAGWCGAHDWRLPSREEVITISDRGRARDGIGVDRTHFPDALPVEYWTGTTFRLYPRSAWAFDAARGLDRTDWKTAAKPVRLVRGPLPASAEAAP